MHAVATELIYKQTNNMRSLHLYQQCRLLVDSNQWIQLQARGWQDSQLQQSINHIILTKNIKINLELAIIKKSKNHNNIYDIIYLS